MKCSLGISNFLEQIYSLFHSIVFLYFFALITEEGFSYFSLLFLGTLHSNGNIFPFMLCFFTSLLFIAICKSSSDNHFALFHFFFLGMVLIPVSCTMSQTLSIVHQALCLSDLVSSIYFSLPLYSHKGFDSGHT